MDAFAYSPLSLTSNLAYGDIGKNSPAATPVPSQAQQQQDEGFGAQEGTRFWANLGQ